MKKIIGLLAVVLTLSGVLAGCGAKDTQLDSIKKAGKLVIGTEAGYAPYEFHYKVDGKDTITGMDIDIAKEIANELGVELEIKDIAFDGLLPALTSGKVDIVIAGMTPDADRRKAVDFSQIYYKAEQGVIVRVEDADKYKAMSDLDGQKIGVQLGTTQEKIAQSQIKNAQITSIGSIGDLVLQLQTKKVDAVIVELPVASLYVASNTDLVVSAATPDDEDGGSAIGIKKNNPSLVKAVDEVIDRLNAEGKIDEFFVNAVKLMEE